PEVYVIRDFVIWRYLGIVLFDFFFHRQPAGCAIEIERMQVLRFDGIGYGDDLRVVILEQLSYIGLALAAATYDRDVDLFAGRNKFRTAQDVPRNDVEGGDCEPAARDE